MHVGIARRRALSSNKRFSLWRVAGRKFITHAGLDLRLTATTGEQRLDVTLDDSIAEGAAVFFAIPFDAGIRHRLSRFEAEARRLNGEPPSPRARGTSRAGLLHLRALQAIDGVRSGASHRDIAVVLVGVDTAKERWSTDGELRAQVRYVVARAEALMGGGYRSLAGLRPKGDEPSR